MGKAEKKAKKSEEGAEKKMKRPRDESASDESEEELEEVEDDLVLEPQEGEEDVQAEFGFFDFVDGDYHLVRRLMQTYLDGTPWNVQDMADMIVKQDILGSSIKIMDEEDVLGFATILNFSKNKKEKCFKEIRDYFVKKAPKEAKDLFVSALDSTKKTLGLFLNERMINVPPVLAPHLQVSLWEDHDWALGHKELSQKERDEFKFDTLLYVTTLAKEKKGAASSKGDKKGKKAKTNDDGYIYVKPEDEIYAEAASARYAYQFQIITNSDGDLKPVDEDMTTHRMVMLIEKSKIKDIRAKLKKLAKEAHM